MFSADSSATTWWQPSLPAQARAKPRLMPICNALSLRKKREPLPRSGRNTGKPLSQARPGKPVPRLKLVRREMNSKASAVRP